MGKKKFDVLDEYNQVRREMLSEQISEALREHPDNWRERLEMVGLVWYEETDNEEYQEEQEAKPQNIDQQQLVDYFEGKINFSSIIIKAWDIETKTNEVNYPLLRRYFRQGNKQLKHLLLCLLSNKPTDIDVINDLVYFHEYYNMFEELITIYTNACIQETDLDLFEILAKDFFYNTCTKEYNALEGLMDIFADNFEKQQVITKIVKEQKQEKIAPDIEF